MPRHRQEERADPFEQITPEQEREMGIEHDEELYAKGIIDLEELEERLDARLGLEHPNRDPS